MRKKKSFERYIRLTFRIVGPCRGSSVSEAHNQLLKAQEHYTSLQPSPLKSKGISSVTPGRPELAVLFLASAPAASRNKAAPPKPLHRARLRRSRCRPPPPGSRCSTSSHVGKQANPRLAWMHHRLSFPFRGRGIRIAAPHPHSRIHLVRTPEFIWSVVGSSAAC